MTYRLTATKTLTGVTVTVLRWEGAECTTIAEASSRTLRGALLLARLRAAHERRSWT